MFFNFCLNIKIEFENIFNIFQIKNQIIKGIKRILLKKVDIYARRR